MFIKYPKSIVFFAVLVTFLVGLGAVLPSVSPEKFSFLNPVKVDTDPENMLPIDEPIRLFHEKMKHRFNIHDMVVVGIINEKSENGVFTKETLSNIYDLSSFAKNLRWEEDDKEVGVIEVDVIAPSTVDSIEPGEKTLQFNWLMAQPPQSDEEALNIRDRALRIPFLRNTLVSTEGDQEGRALCIYLPITSKNVSYKVYSKLKEKISTLSGDEKYYITGLPVAEDTFGVEMFKQMGVSAPIAMLVILILMLVFFGKLIVVISPLIVAFFSVVITMGALVIAGYPIHIMSSMIPIFIMPISILDSVHIISEFFDRYSPDKDRKETVIGVMKELFMPMLYTTLTTIAGFASLSLTPIPPVQVFGIFVALGVFVAWILTITFIPAFLMLISQKRLENFGTKSQEKESFLSKMLAKFGKGSYAHAKLILVCAIVLASIAVYGISQLVVNDNPIKWFSKSHQIRKADKKLNKFFGGTYMAYLALEVKEEGYTPREYATQILQSITGKRALIMDSFVRLISRADIAEGSSKEEFLDDLELKIKPNVQKTSDDDLFAWSVVKTFIDMEASYEVDFFAPRVFAEILKARAENTKREIDTTFNELKFSVRSLSEKMHESKDLFLEDLREKVKDLDKSDTTQDAINSLLGSLRGDEDIFKQPIMLAYISQLQDALYKTGIVGKSNSLSEIVKTINRDLHEGKEGDYRIPRNKSGVAQCIAQFESSHRPDDLYHFVSNDYRSANIWIQMKSGDNRDMMKVANAAEKFLSQNEPYFELTHNWFGLTYLNVIWQEKMVKGMLEALLGGFLVVFLLMIILFRSVLWGILSMLPLTLTIGAIYGTLGIIGKNYDMPVAVLSSLTLGLAIDFAIHFLSRSRKLYLNSWEETSSKVFEEPARAITRNIIIIAAGFLPLIFASLVPYKTVGILLASILLTSGIVSFALLPAIIRLLEKHLFKEAPKMKVACDCVICIASSLLLTFVIALVLHQYFKIKWTALTWIALILVPIIAGICNLMSRRDRCKIEEEEEEEDKS